MTESTQHELGPSRLQPPTSGSVRASAPNLARASGGKRTLEPQKVEADTTSDKATAAFIRRTLCSQDVLLGNGERLQVTSGQRTESPTLARLEQLVGANLGLIRTEFGRFGRQVSGYSLEHLLP